ncbi:MAG: CAAX amino terminal protease self- immunity [Tenericutes bacterium ADurb.Bin087]|nr:MAG: CAAX amino terminal protease self- immunity [Tenericutes bacterium ADurb.Bin087]
MDEQEKVTKEANVTPVDANYGLLIVSEESPSYKRLKSPGFSYALFFASIVLMFFSSFIIQTIAQAILGETDDAAAFAFVNFWTFVLTFSLIVVFLAVSKTLPALIKKFLKLRPYITGVFYGFIVIMTSVITTLVMQIIFGQADENLNQQIINLVLSRYPVSSFFWIVFLGPLVEELTYRAGLFNALSRRNRILAYVVSSAIFGFMHFNIPFDAEGAIDKAKLIEEFINIPSYIVSGVVFGFIYEKEGFAGSSVAHITNNLVSYILSIINIYAGK